jgi:hypothetical protein
MKHEHTEPSSVTIAKETHEPSKITTFTIQITADAPYKQILKKAVKVLDEHK